MALSGLLSSAQLNQFEELGYVHVPGAIPRSTVETLLAETDSLFSTRGETPDQLAWWSSFHRSTPEPGKRDVMEIRNVIANSELFASLIDTANILLPICQLLGPRVCLLSSHLHVRGHSYLSEQEVAACKLGWHRDLGACSAELPEPQPLLSVKVALWLTSIFAPFQGAMQIVPGSHRLKGKPPIDPTTNRPFGAIEVHAEPGDLFFFEQRLWHAGAPNLSQCNRKVVFLSYGYRWLRPQDYICFDSEYLSRQNRVRFQLLGGSVSSMGFHLPTPDDLPLVQWFRKHLEQAQNHGEQHI